MHVHVQVCVYYLHKINVIAMTKVLGIQNQRLAQCQYAKVILQSELPLQVDGEAWIQEAGAILVMHKNRSRMLVKDRVSRWR